MATDCVFPRCELLAEPDSDTCTDHHNVTVAASGSWVDDTHLEGGHG